MEINNIAEEKTECDSVTALELQKSKRILYFSDGVIEEFSESEGEDIGPDITDRSVNIDLNALTLGHRIKYQVYQIGSRILNGIDFVGEGLASFFGITTPKYISESDIDYATKGECQMYDNISHSNEGGGWPQNNNTITSNIVITSFSQNAANSTQ